MNKVRYMLKASLSVGSMYIKGLLATYLSTDTKFYAGHKGFQETTKHQF